MLPPPPFCSPLSWPVNAPKRGKEREAGHALRPSPPLVNRMSVSERMPIRVPLLSTTGAWLKPRLRNRVAASSIVSLASCGVRGQTGKGARMEGLKTGHGMLRKGLHMCVG